METSRMEKKHFENKPYRGRFPIYSEKVYD